MDSGEFFAKRSRYYRDLYYKTVLKVLIRLVTLVLFFVVFFGLGVIISSLLLGVL